MMFWFGLIIGANIGYIVFSLTRNSKICALYDEIDRLENKLAAGLSPQVDQKAGAGGPNGTATARGG